MTKGDKYYETITWLTESCEKKEETRGPFEYKDAQYFLDGLQRTMRAHCSGVKIQIWTSEYNEWSGPFKNIEFSFFTV